MGFFSWKCKRCGLSMVAETATDPVTSWQAQAVLVGTAGEVLMRGTYDGYGRIGAGSITERVEDDAACLYHDACYEVATREGTVDTSPSRWARDQGFFFDEGQHDLAPPTVDDADGWLARQRKLRGSR